MAFDLKPTTGLEIRYISIYDPAIDWDATETEHHFSRDDYIEDASDERIDSLIFKNGQTPTVFLLGQPDPKVINEAMKADNPIEGLQHMARRYILSAENLSEGGRKVTLRRKGGKILDQRSENSIPPQVFHEIGRVLLERGGMTDDPFSS